MADNPANGIIALNLAAIAASIHTWRLMANRGLLSPDDVEDLAHSLTASFDEMNGDPFSEHLRSLLEAQISPGLAEIRQTASATYKKR